jgi:hypothetical protein
MIYKFHFHTPLNTSVTDDLVLDILREIFNLESLQISKIRAAGQYPSNNYGGIIGNNMLLPKDELMNRFEVTFELNRVFSKEEQRALRFKGFVIQNETLKA